MIESKWGSPHEVILSPSDQMVQMIRVVQGGTEVGGSRVVRVVQDGTKGDLSSPSDLRWTEVHSLRSGLDLVEFRDMTESPGKPRCVVC